MNENLARPVDEAEAAALPLPYQASPRLRILVVDDDHSTRQINTLALSHSGYAVTSAEDGAAAWELLRKSSYDLLVTDNRMPNVTGVELLRRLHASGMCLPSIMATGTFPAEEFDRQPWLKPDGVVLKPYPIAELVRTVKKVLSEANGTGEGSPRFRHGDMPASRREVMASAADHCEPTRACIPELPREENVLATGTGPSSSGAPPPSFEGAH